ncbi:restriction endonuclease subunit S, partial [Mariniblastus sp.]|nr:restriction endonuclease subunit S [Mariniblastus sp.]
MWKSVTVEAIAAKTKNALVGGPFGSNLVSRDYVDSGVPVIRGANMGARWLSGDFAFVTPEKANSLSSNIARPGDLIFTQRGTLGQVSLVPYAQFDRYVISQSQMKLSPDISKADVRFLYYVFTSPAQLDYIQRNAIQTGVPHTNLGILRDTRVGLPPLLEQRKIAHILGTLDDKIELNRRMNETLESMARALFKSWFVDFDPVIDNALAAGNPIPESLQARAETRRALGSQRKPLPENTQKLFPDAFVFDEEMGWIPEGWEVGKLGDVGAIKTGRTPSTKVDDNFGEDVPFVTPSDMEGTLFVTTTNRSLSRTGVESVKTAYLPARAICVSCIGSDMGKTVLTHRGAVTNQQINSILPTN